MHGILSFAKFGIAKHEKADRKKLLGYFKNISDSGNRLLNLLNSLLDLSKLESGKEDFSYADVDINSITLTVKSELEGLAHDKNINVKTTFNTSELMVECDGEKISQVIRNMLGNAFKFTPEGKSISVITCASEMVDKNSESSSDTINSVKVSVIDEGIGIPEDELTHVFDKFAQSSSTDNGSGGTGLGLAICTEIIEKHNGTIWAENNSSGGASFTFEFPQKFHTH